MAEPLPYEVVHELGLMSEESRAWAPPGTGKFTPPAVRPPGDQLPMELWGPDFNLVIDFTAFGDPVGQGQVSFLGKGRPAIHKNQAILYPWRGEIGRSFAAWVVRMGQLSPWEPIDGAVAVDRWYTVKRPAAKASWRPWPTVGSQKNSDIDHFDRAVFDALHKDAGAITDDARIVGGKHWKAYPGTHPLCPPEPGVRIQIYTVGDPQ